jgi:hypothetical protein
MTSENDFKFIMKITFVAHFAVNTSSNFCVYDKGINPVVFASIQR